MTTLTLDLSPLAQKVFEHCTTDWQQVTSKLKTMADWPSAREELKAAGLIEEYYGQIRRITPGSVLRLECDYQCKPGDIDPFCTVRHSFIREMPKESDQGQAGFTDVNHAIGGMTSRPESFPDDDDQSVLPGQRGSAVIRGGIHRGNPSWSDSMDPFADSAVDKTPVDGPQIDSEPVNTSDGVQLPERQSNPSENEPDGFKAINDAIAAMSTPVERVNPAAVDSLEASWTTSDARTRRRHGGGQDFINEWVRSLGHDPKLKKHAGVKFAAAVLATYADEKTGTVALGMAEWAEAAGMDKRNLVVARDKLVNLLWIKATGKKVGQRIQYDLVIPDLG